MLIYSLRGVGVHSQPVEYDVLIIGAGAAGLAAAGELARAGRSALVLEARDRIGGRIFPQQEPGLAVPVELGAEFIHGRAKATFALLQRSGGAAIDAARTRFSLRDGKLQPSIDLFGEVCAAMQRTTILEAKDMSFAAFLDRHLRPVLSAEACALARMRVEGYDAADPARASARAIIREWTGGGSADHPQFRPLGGNTSVLAALSGALDGTKVQIQLQSVVRRVNWKRGRVEISGTHLDRPFRVCAPRAIVTLPIGVLKSRARGPGTVQFIPALAQKQDALKKLAAGPVLKVSLRFRSAFWEKLDRGRYRNASFFHAPHALFPTFWTTLPVRTPLVVAWAGGPRAARLSKASRPQVIKHAVASFVSLFGKARGVIVTLQDAWLHDWQRDPFARGAYSHVLVDGEGATDRLAQPLANTLFFAGEATDTAGHAGTVAGALQSGTRAAREVTGRRRRRTLV